MTGVYLVHFDRPYQHAEHYLGFAKDIAKRLAKHKSGNGARLVQVAQDAGITWSLVRVWPNASRVDERKLKNRGSAKRICPVCGGCHSYRLITRSKKLQAFIKQQ